MGTRGLLGAGRAGVLARVTDLQGMLRDQRAMTAAAEGAAAALEARCAELQAAAGPPCPRTGKRWPAVAVIHHCCPTRRGGCEVGRIWGLPPPPPSVLETVMYENLSGSYPKKKKRQGPALCLPLQLSGAMEPANLSGSKATGCDCHSPTQEAGWDPTAVQPVIEGSYQGAWYCRPVR